MMKACCFIKNYTQIYHWELSPDEMLIYNRSDVGKFIQGWDTYTYDNYIYDNNVTSEEEAIERLKEEQLKCLQDQIDVLNSTIRKINLL